MINKYCKKLHPVVAQCRGASPIWKKLVFVRDLIENQIWWKIEKGDASFWYDNWTAMGDLYHILPEAGEEEIEVRKFTDAQGWEEQKLRDHLPEDYVIFIIKKLPPPKQTSRVDKPVWMPKASGNFSVRSAWEYIRQKDQEEDIFTYMWSKILPFKQSFLLWRMWKFRVPVDEVVQSMGINLVSRCWYCIQPKSETVSHLFLTSYTDAKLWRLFANKHKPKLYYLPVCWKPPEGILKCNMDGASRGNPGRSSYGFWLRKSVGDLVYAQGEEIQEGTNLEAEAVAIREALTHYVREGVMQVCLETESEVLIKILTRIWKVAWSIAVVIEDIWGFSQECQVQIQHVYREGNTLADYLANLAFFNPGRIVYNSFAELPSQAKKL
ncbi:hypothetical protein R3W88_011693 [Solanum pinnatisectum]|uniref:RNase H type-1 domain-containing protein n=1 Tax=Solanum pinnatisectum TaxID=50273 RepID=A0AAV9LAI3_9SOLN|nr:hypothetical protein R3W88_011693 [Solanum pinnatisectum]